jgi:hypothetical protein
MNRSSAHSARKAQLGMTVALGAAIALGGGLALVTSHNAHGTPLRAEAPEPVAELAAQTDPPAEPAAATLNGSVLETLAVSKYTYLRLATVNGEIWAAVPSVAVAIGTRVAIANATRMVDFESATLKRTFKVIYFGTLAAPSAAPVAPKFSPADALDDDEQDLPPGHPDIGATSPNSAPTEAQAAQALPPGHPDLGADTAHGGPAPVAASAPAFAVVPVLPAGGKNGHTILQLATLGGKLAGQRVRVRGQVTKVTPNVQGHTFFHLRDGSPGAPGPATDLIVTSSLEPKRGEVATFEGTLRADVDIGIGYHYPLLLENALIVSE